MQVVCVERMRSVYGVVGYRCVSVVYEYGISVVCVCVECMWSACGMCVCAACGVYVCVLCMVCYKRVVCVCVVYVYAISVWCVCVCYDISTWCVCVYVVCGML